jgi:hypothetical protein
MTFKRVDFPEPDVPRITTKSPSFMEREIPFNTWFLLSPLP